MKRPPSRSRLTEAEADRARAIAERHGVEKAARLLGLCDARTLTKAIARLEVSHLTAGTVRANLGRTI